MPRFTHTHIHIYIGNGFYEHNCNRIIFNVEIVLVIEINVLLVVFLDSVRDGDDNERCLSLCIGKQEPLLMLI